MSGTAAESLPPPAPVTTTPRTNNNSNQQQRGRPPKPVGVPFGGGVPHERSSSEDYYYGGTQMRDVSERSRSSLKELTLSKRRSSLTAAEEGFLLELIEYGDEIEVQVAYENLLDDELFFPIPTQVALLDESETGWGDSLIQMGRERDNSIRSCSQEDVITNMHSVMDESSRTLTSFCSSTHNMGSERRQALLQERRNSLSNNLHGKMWKAHENGLAV